MFVVVLVWIVVMYIMLCEYVVLMELYVCIVVWEDDCFMVWELS